MSPGIDLSGMDPAARRYEVGLYAMAMSMPTTSSTGRLRPSAVPKLRAQSCAAIPDWPWGPETEAMAVSVTHLRTARLYWASADMSALAVAAAASLPGPDLYTPPTPTGLLVFDGGAGGFPFVGGQRMPVDAVGWGPRPAGPGLLLTWYLARWRITEAVAVLGAVMPQDLHVPPLCPAGHTEIDENGPVGQGFDAPTVAAAWHLMSQPSLAETSEVGADKKTARAAARAGTVLDPVTVVELRRQYRPTDPAHAPDEQPGRYHHRWVVTGHWRNQPHGPDRAQRKRIWIPDHVKGPDGAPLLVRERVNVWRR
ncbi:hypothetical protein ACWEVD_00610 [Nocardia thailandica]